MAPSDAQDPEHQDGGSVTPEHADEAPADDEAHPLEAQLDVYPLREPSEDPGWAVKIVWTWVGFALLALAFIVWLVIMSFLKT